ncbi:MAG TPA: hypothetical protein VMA72_24420 [Streptosporangiaceae bacterium]|nr:hypothetical protein [Streptosporangiaceae bacterium]
MIVNYLLIQPLPVAMSRPIATLEGSALARSAMARTRPARITRTELRMAPSRQARTRYASRAKHRSKRRVADPDQVSACEHLGLALRGDGGSVFRLHLGSLDKSGTGDIGTGRRCRQSDGAFFPLRGQGWTMVSTRPVATS